MSITKAFYSEKPDRIAYYPQKDGSAEAYLRQNIAQEPDEEGGMVWTADEVFLRTHLSEEDIEEQFESYFEENLVTTIEDLAEAIEILAGIILEG